MTEEDAPRPLPDSAGSEPVSLPALIAAVASGQLPLAGRLGPTVARAIVDQLPNEDIIYLGDTARAPYGVRSISEVREYALECLDHLVDRGVKALVIACNSASSAVLRLSLIHI